MSENAFLETCEPVESSASPSPNTTSRPQCQTARWPSSVTFSHRSSSCSSCARALGARLGAGKSDEAQSRKGAHRAVDIERAVGGGIEAVAQERAPGRGQPVEIAYRAAAVAVRTCAHRKADHVGIAGIRRAAHLSPPATSIMWPWSPQARLAVQMRTRLARIWLQVRRAAPASRTSRGEAPKRTRNAPLKRDRWLKPTSKAIMLTGRSERRGSISMRWARARRQVEDEGGDREALGLEQALQLARRHAVARRDGCGRKARLIEVRLDVLP